MSSVNIGTISYPLWDLGYDFDRHPIRRKSISWIELRFPDGSIISISPLSQVRGVQRGGSRPIGFIWHNPAAISVTPSLINWIETEFRHLFHNDPIMWTASVTTAPKGLQPILLGTQ